MDAEPSNEGLLIASEADLQAFASQPGVGLNEALRGVLAETALTGRVRYDWQLLKPLFHTLIDSVFSEYAAAEQVEVGPPRPIPGGSSLEGRLSGLHALLDGFAAAPFTVQRLCEVLLEPSKQYRVLYKLAYAIEKLLLVTSTRPTSGNLPPRPALSSLGPVNENPPSPYLTNASGGNGSGSRVQQAGQSHLPNGREEGGNGSPTGAHPPTGRGSAVFRMFMHAEAATAAATAAVSGDMAGSGDGGGAAEGIGGDALISEVLAEQAAEAELAKQFVEDALRTDPEPGGDEQADPAHSSPAAGASKADASDGQQRAAAVGQGLLKQQHASEGGGTAPVAAASSTAPAAAEAGGGSDPGAAGQQQAQQTAQQEEPGAAMEIDGGAGGEATQGAREQSAGAGEQTAGQAAAGGEQAPAGAEGMETGQ